MLEAFLVSLFGVLIYQLVGVALFLPLELVSPKSSASFADKSRGILFLLAVAPIAAAVATALAALKAELGIRGVPIHSSLGLPVVASVALALWADLQFYIVHRLEHRFFWRFHRVHHAIRTLSAANSFHHWTEPLMGLTIAVPLMFVDIQIGPTLGFLTALFTYQQFYIHSTSGLHFGPVRCLLVDNRYHRIHHSVDAAHHDKNFGAMTPLWDWLFGTLYMPAKGEWPEVGLAEVGEPTNLAEWSSLPWRPTSFDSSIERRRTGWPRRGPAKPPAQCDPARS